MKQYRKKLLL